MLFDPLCICLCEAAILQPTSSLTPFTHSLGMSQSQSFPFSKKYLCTCLQQQQQFSKKVWMEAGAWGVDAH